MCALKQTLVLATSLSGDGKCCAGFAFHTLSLVSYDDVPATASTLSCLQHAGKQDSCLGVS